MAPRTTNMTVVLMVATLVAASLAGCTAATDTSSEPISAIPQRTAADPPADPVSTKAEDAAAESSMSATPEDACQARADFSAFETAGGTRWVRTGHLVDTGPSLYAAGMPSVDLAEYAIADGDTLEGISDRFCISRAALASYGPIYAGTVLILDPSIAAPAP